MKLSPYHHIVTILLIAGYAASASASYVYYRYGNQEQYVGSVPYVSDGFYYSDGTGNSISIRKTRHVPVVVYQYPNARWVTVSGELPRGAIVMEYINGYPVYYCRMVINGRLQQGQFVPGRGCMLGQHNSVSSSINVEILIGR